MIDAGATDLWLHYVMPALSAIALVLALVIVLKAVRGYRQNDDRAMLLLATGLFLLLLAPLLVGLGTFVLFDETVHTDIARSTVQQLFRIAGMVAILASMYVRR